MKRIRHAGEPEAIAAFLKSEFYYGDYEPYRAQFGEIVRNPDLTNEKENAIRRALLFHRRGHMWRELVPDTQWWEVRLEPEDLAKIRVFPRAQWWRASTGGDYRISSIAERLERGLVEDAAFVAKLKAIGADLERSRAHSSVLLIGIDEHKPVTILEGNHRLTAALLVGPELVCDRFTVLCGFSPNMAKCCWYETNLATLWRYAKHRARNIVDREGDVERVLAALEWEPQSAGVVSASTVPETK